MKIASAIRIDDIWLKINWIRHISQGLIALANMAFMQ